MIKVFEGLSTAGGQGNLESFRRELSALAAIHHPAVVDLVEFGVEHTRDRGYVVLEHLQGPDIATAAARVSRQTLINLLIQACSAVDQLHRRGLVHADLKPQHFILARPIDPLRPNATVKLVDLASCCAEDVAVDSRGLSLTPAYAAPEVFMDRRLSFLSDLFSLGAVFLDCLGVEREMRDSPQRTSWASGISSRTPRYAPRSFEDDLARVAFALLEPDPHNRPSSARAVIRQLVSLASRHGLELLEPAALAPPFERTTLVGREKVTEHFEAVLQAIESPSLGVRPTIFVLEGAPGSGRSRMLRELAVRCALRRIHAHTITADSLDSLQSVPWPSTDGISVLLCDLPYLTHLDSVVRPILTNSPSAQPAVLVIATLPGESQRTPILGEMIHSGAYISLDRYPLPSLTIHDIAVAIRKTLAITTVHDDIASQVHSASAGHPARAWAFLRWALENDKYKMEHDSLAPVSVDPVVPPVTFTLEHVTPILERIDDIALGIARLMALSSVPLTTDDLTIAGDLPTEAIAEACDRLERHGIIAAGLTAPLQYSVMGETVRAALQNGIDAPARKALHLALANSLVRGETVPIRCHALAEHSLAAGYPQRAFAYFRQAAALSLSGEAPRQAIRSLLAALELGGDDAQCSAEIALELWSAHRKLGRWPDSLAAVEHVSIDVLSDGRLRCRILLSRAQALHEIGRHAEAVTIGREALRVARAEKAHVEHTEALYILGTSLCWLHRRSAGVRVLARAIRLARRHSRLDIAAHCFNDLALALWTSGNYRLALAYERRRSRLLTKLLGHTPVPNASPNIGILLTDLGRYRAAAKTFREVGVGLRPQRMPSALGPVLSNHGEVYRATGALRVAFCLYQHALSHFTRCGQPHRAAVATSNIALVLCRAGFLRQSYALLAHRLSSRVLSGDPRYQLMHLLTWSRILQACGAYAAAHKAAARALRLAYTARLSNVILESKTLMAEALIKAGHGSAGAGLVHQSLRANGRHSPFESRLAARLTLASAIGSVGGPANDVLPLIDQVIRTTRRKRMHSYLLEASLLKTSVLLTLGKTGQAEGIAREMTLLARSSHDRRASWRSHYWLGRAYEQGLRYKRALRCYRIAMLLVRELSQDVPKDRLRHTFLAQPEARDSLDRYERLKKEVGRQARHDLASLSRSEAVSRRMLASLSAIGQKLSSILDLDQLLASILDMAIENVGAERGVVFLRQEGSGELLPESARGLGGRDLEDLSRFSRSVIEQAAGGRTLLTVDVGQDPALQHVQSVTVNEIKSILCVPMRARGRVAGVLYLDTQKATRLFTERDRSFVESFASQAAIAIDNARLFGTIRAENSRLRQEVEGRFKEIIGSSAPIRRLRETIAGLLDNDCTVLITGESGTGKGIVARVIHANSERHKARFMAVDCGALPENLLEAELFGYRRGAFTGADRDRAGLIEAAAGGTLFLDEITNTSLGFQARLLRVLQEREVRRLGENEVRKVDVRVIAATNVDIKALMAAGRFRQDLYYRLNVVTVEVPPLRARLEDIPLLTQHFLARRAREAPASGEGGAGGTGSPRVLGPGVVEALMRHEWPGNVRELENLIERLCVLTRGEVITHRDLGELAFTGAAPAGSAMVRGASTRTSARTGEQIMIEDALRRHQGDKAKAARFIGWNRQKLYRRMRSYAIPADFGKAA